MMTLPILALPDFNLCFEIETEAFGYGDVKKYCDEYLICQRNKTLALSPVGLLMPLEIPPLEIPDATWSDISMDFIEGLLKVVGWEVILVMVDKLRLKLNRSSTYHPQADGQTKVVNRGIEAYLRCFRGEKSKEWVKWLH
ncbi:ty3-gypsy retrotransposon protein [Cucumis melo var. makuwa]|uniref:Ty3-gypsy retrotransposon protein n=1 Tax=Cucumis melo var. makuwa TaxID=1194695 RepID=A0A5A7TI20_CUCMM|nr:ty3-gypsy retrotransposon protein [Cucumis melo var. makuwa]TYK16073.1 ty3-gypsy retrotransposon protein [Cucumis melo var. makuwa]